MASSSPTTTTTTSSSSSSLSFALLALLVLLAATPTTSFCPIDGCDTQHTFFLSDPLPGDRAPKPAFSSPLADARCSTQDLGAIICSSSSSSSSSGPGSGARAMHMLNTTGGIQWSARSIPSRNVPIVGADGPIVLSDGTQLMGLGLDGRPVGPNIQIEPPLGPVWSPTVTNNGVFILGSLFADLAGYLTNGVPHASLWLNATISGVAGSFTSVAQPCVVGARVYLLTRFQPSSSSSSSSSNLRASKGVCRLYAVDVNRNIDDRLEVAWFYESPCDPTSPSFPLTLVQQQQQQGRWVAVFPSVNGTNGQHVLVGVADRGHSAFSSFVIETPSPVVSLTAPLNTSAPSVWFATQDGQTVAQVDLEAGKVVDSIDIGSLRAGAAICPNISITSATFLVAHQRNVTGLLLPVLAGMAAPSEGNEGEEGQVHEQQRGLFLLAVVPSSPPSLLWTLGPFSLPAAPASAMPPLTTPSAESSGGAAATTLVWPIGGAVLGFA